MFKEQACGPIRSQNYELERPAKGLASGRPQRSALVFMRKFKTMLAVATAVALLAPSAASAASGREQGGYAGSNDVVGGLEQGSGGGGGPTATTGNAGGAGGSLPF